MTEPIEIRLANARAALDEQEWLTEKLKETGNEARRLDDHLDTLSAAAKKEQADVDALEGFGLQSVLHSILGGKGAKLDKERGEAVAAKLKHEVAKAELGEVRQRLFKIKELVDGLGDPQAEYKAVLADKERWLIDCGGAQGEEVLRCAEVQGSLTTKLRELDETVQAGNDADNIMEKMLGYLREARGWGYADIAGIGFGDPLMDRWEKYDAFGAAHVDAVDARHALSRLQSGLRDVHLKDCDVELPSQIVKFADWFVDGLVVDLFVQSKIEKSIDSVETCQAQVQGILAKLKPMHVTLRSELVESQASMKTMLETSDAGEL